MPLRNPQELGLRREWARRYGVNGFPNCGGINKEGDPSSILPHELRHAENLRYTEGFPKARGGQQKTITVAIGSIQGLTDIDDISAFLVSPVVAGGLTSRLDWYNQDREVAYVASIALSLVATSVVAQTEPRRSIFRMGTRVLAIKSTGEISEVVLPESGADQELTKFNKLLDAPGGIFPWASNAAVRREIVPSAVNEDGTKAALRTADVAYLGTVLGKVYRYDGTQLSEDADLGGDRLITGIFQESIVACGNLVFAVRQDPNPETATKALWVSHSFPAGITIFNCSAIQEHKDGLYISGQASGLGPNPLGVILLWDGNTLTLARTPVHGLHTSDDAWVADLQVFETLLCYLWHDTESDVLLGTYDGTTWTDDAGTVGVGDTAGLISSGALLTDNNRLYATHRGFVGLLSDLVLLSQSNPGSVSTWTVVFNYGDLIPPPTILMIQG